MICDGLSAHIVVLTGPLSVSTQLFAGSLEGRHKLAPLLSPIRHAIRLMKKGRAASCHSLGRARHGQGRAGLAPQARTRDNSVTIMCGTVTAFSPIKITCHPSGSPARCLSGDAINERCCD